MEKTDGFCYFANKPYVKEETDMMQRRFYPVGIQTFSEIREKNYLYIDKTGYVYRMTNSNSKYVFLSRPRRFGKSLLTSTLHSYFEGRKELFEGLAIEGLETEWTRYPVLHFDMSTAKHVNREQLEQELNLKLLKYEKIYGREEGEINANQRLQGLIGRAYAQTGRQVVVLIDEYDAPLLDVMHEEKNLPTLRNVMRNFYSPLKACDPYLRFVFLTGITKFSQLSIFSELNNIKNISMDEPYAAICGITEDEMLTQMKEDIGMLAAKLNISPEEVLLKLKENYDGYHFSWPSPDVFNPFSLLKAMALGEIGSYWFESGTPTYIIEMLRKYAVLPSEIGGEEASPSDFNVPLELATNYMPLLYQAGYLTIKGADLEFDAYMLDIPNKEVRVGLMKSLIPSYVTSDSHEVNSVVRNLARNIVRGDMDEALKLLQAFLSTVPYCDNTDYEGHYQQMLYVIFSLLGIYTDVEVHTLKGRVDMVLRTRTTLYLVELKLNQNAETAMKQIDLQQYADRFTLCGLPVVKVAINFSAETRTIADWVISRGTYA